MEAAVSAGFDTGLALTSSLSDFFIVQYALFAILSISSSILTFELLQNTSSLANELY